MTLAVDDGDYHGSMPPGVTAVFAPNHTLGDSSVLTLTVSAATAPGVYSLNVWGYVWGDTTGAYESAGLLVLTVTTAEAASH